MMQKSIVFCAAVRGFHVYKISWKPQEGEILECLQEEHNPCDVFSIKVPKSKCGGTSSSGDIKESRV